jgi:festuclavine dehydrogenase
LTSLLLTENFSEGEHLQSIRDDNVIVSAAGDGKIPFVSVEDIARVAFHALTDEKIHSDEYHIVGPQLLSYDQVSKVRFPFKTDALKSG